MKKKFITVGQTLQTSADSIKEANERFVISCNICMEKKLNYNCDKCPIKIANALKVAALATNETDDEGSSK